MSRRAALTSYDLSTLSVEEQHQLALLITKARLPLPVAPRQPVKLTRAEIKKINHQLTLSPGAALVLTRKGDHVRVYTYDSYHHLVESGKHRQQQVRLKGVAS